MSIQVTVWVSVDGAYVFSTLSLGPRGPNSSCRGADEYGVGSVDVSLRRVTTILAYTRIFLLNEIRINQPLKVKFRILVLLRLKIVNVRKSRHSNQFTYTINV